MDKSTLKEVRQNSNFFVKVLLIFNLTFFLGRPAGYDRVRNAEIGNKDFELSVLEEAYTSEHWIVRIYKVKDYPNRGV